MKNLTVICKWAAVAAMAVAAVACSKKPVEKPEEPVDEYGYPSTFRWAYGPK